MINTTNIIKFHVGDKVRILPHIIDKEQEGVITEVDDGSTEKMGTVTYLVKTPSGYIMWLREESIKLISIGREKVVFT